MKRARGFTLVEVVVATAIIVVFLAALVEAFNLYLKLSIANTYGVQAAYIAEEGLEAARVMRDDGWTANISTLATSSTYYLTFQSGTWKSTTTPSMIDSIFLRTFQVLAVNRDASSNISSSGTNDANTKLVRVSVAWSNHGATTTESVSAYLANINDD